jgi:hypothetical protein
MSTYTVNGCGHQILSKLANGPAFFEELVKLGRDRRDVHFTTGALSRERLIEVTRRGYEITTLGREKWASLEAAAGAPHAKVYGLRAGAP